MSIIEDELRRVLDAHSGDAPPTADRSTQLGRRIRRHRRVRVAAAAAVAAVTLVVAGAVASQLHIGRTAAPTPGTVGSTNAPPGELPQYYSGGKLAVGGTANLADRQVVTFTYTPTDWNFFIGSTCAAPTDFAQSVTVNGKPLASGGCAPQAGMGGFSSMFDDPSRTWRGVGVELGRPMTVVATMGRSGGKSAFDNVTPAPTVGTASVGVYVNVPWAEFPLPTAPSERPSPGGMATDLSGAPKIGVLDADDAEPDAVRTMSVTLTGKIEVDTMTAAPGTVAIYLDEVQIGWCASYGWGGGCGGGPQTVGEGRLAAFHAGQTVTLRVVPEHFTGPTAWRVDLYGK
jgi:hypothetical protein